MVDVVMSAGFCRDSGGMVLVFILIASPLQLHKSLHYYRFPSVCTDSKSPTIATACPAWNVLSLKKSTT